MPYKHVYILTILVFLLSAKGVRSVHDSLNFLLKAGTRQCFFEDYNKGTPARTLEVFVQAGGTNDVLLTIHGPLELDEIRNVRQPPHMNSTFRQ